MVFLLWVGGLAFGRRKIGSCAASIGISGTAVDGRFNPSLSPLSVAAPRSLSDFGDRGEE